MILDGRVGAVIAGPRPAAAPAAAPVVLKARVGGLVTVTDCLQGDTAVSSSKLNNGINHTMIRIGWDVLEPTQGHYDFTFLDGLINGAPVGTMFKFGVDTARHAPSWLTALGTVDVVNSADSVTATCPYWWTETAHQAYLALHTALGAHYDSDSRVLQVVVTGSMQAYMEPLILGGDAASGVRLWNLGVTQTVQQNSVERSLRETMASWPTTRVELATHYQFQVPKSTGINFIDWTAGCRDWLNPLAAEFGDRLVVTDYGVGPTDTLAANDPTGQNLSNATHQYGWMYLRRALAQGAVAYQLTLGSFSVANLKAAIENCIALKGSYAETSGYNALTTTDRATYDAALKAQA